MLSKFNNRPRLKKIGDTFLLLSASLTTAVMSLPLSDNTIKWLVFGLNIVGVCGKIITNVMCKDE
jgi:branched-subunit amino acid permease